MIWCGRASRFMAASLREAGRTPSHQSFISWAASFKCAMCPPGETVGYGATRTLKRPSRVAIVSVGYADGFFRSLSTSDGETGFVAYAGPHAAPILGRVSMDLITVDVTEVPEAFSARGRWVELMGPHVTAQTVAHHAGTIDYEVLTNLGARAFRRYIGS